jgi:F-type H+-transporting ATPase subunit gamma
MKRPQEILAEEKSMRTIVGLTGAFESLSSMKIVLTKRGVLTSNVFFSDVWNIYKNIRVTGMFQFGRRPDEKPVDKELYILITAPAGLSGDIDQRLIRLMRKDYDPEKNDIIVIGKHGAQQLSQLGIKYDQFFNLPKKDPINVEPLMMIVKQYRETRIFYQNYISLMTQDVRSIRLSDIIETKGAAAESQDSITEATYIFEPNPLVVVAHMETSMLRLALLQLIYDSRLAQHASRFRAMSSAHQRATEEVNTLHMRYNRAKRGIVDTRLKEISAGLKKIRQREDY